MQDPRIALVEKKFHKDADSIPEFRSGDTVKVHVKVKEGNRERIQVFEGVVIGRQHGGLRENFIVRKMSSGVGVERIFPVHCPCALLRSCRSTGSGRGRFFPRRRRSTSCGR